MQQSLFKSAIVWVMMMCGVAAFAQSVEEMPVHSLRAPAVDASLDAVPGLAGTLNVFSTNSARPQWDIQFDYNVSDTSNTVSQAGAIYFGGEFWTSQWNSDTIVRYTSTGSLIEKFTIPGVTGIRAFTRDDTSLYAGAAGLEIYQIDPATKTLINTITTNFTGGCRFVTYDSVGVGGVQGFWVGNFNTDIVFVDMMGTAQVAIPAATHGLGGMYGATIDHISIGGPYIWVFHQSNGPSQATISQLSLPNGGAPTGVQRDVDADFGGTGGLAGGLFISTEIVPGENTLGGINQGVNLFGYELDFSPIQIDGAIDAFQVSDLYATMPVKFGALAVLDGEVTNNGVTTLDTLLIDISAIDLATSAVLLDEDRLFTAVPFATTNQFVTTPVLPTEVGQYLFQAVASIGQQVDEIPANDIFQALYTVTDSVYGRDDDLAASSVQLGPGPGGLVMVYDFPAETYIQGVEIRGGTFDAGDVFNISGIAIPVNAGTVAGPPAATGPNVTITGVDSTYYLPFSAPIPITSGTFIAVGFSQVDDSAFFVRTSPTNAQAGALSFSTDASLTAWTTSGFGDNLFIRPVVVPCNKLSVNVTAFPDTGMDNGGAVAQAVNALGTATYAWSTGAAGPGVQGITGPDTITVTVSDANSCSVTDTVIIDRIISSVEVPASQPLFRIQPNPATDVVEIILQTGTNEDYLLNLYDRQGRLIYQAEGSTVSRPQVSWALGDLAAGMYIVEYVSETAINKQQLIVK